MQADTGFNYLLSVHKRQDLATRRWLESVGSESGYY